MERRFLLEQPHNESVVAKCGFDRKRGFTVEVFVEDRPTTSFSAADINSALELLVEHGFLTADDLKSAHEIILDEPTVPMSEGTRGALEAVLNVMRVAAD